MERLLRMLLECTISMSVVALLLMTLMPLLERRYSARGLYIAWVVVIAGFLVPWRPQVPKAAIQIKVPPAQVLPIGYAAQHSLAQDAGPYGQMPQQGESTQQAAAEPVAAPPASRFAFPEITTTELLGMIYLAGVLAVAGLRLWHHRRFVRSVRRWSRPVESRICLEALGEACHEMGIRQRPALLRCQSIDSPMLIGFFRPCLLIPDTRFSLAEFSLVLRHELTHLKRHDLWGRLLLMLASVLHWFNPLMPVFARAFSLRCELSCDAEVMRGMDMDTRQYYSETIIHSLSARPSAATALSTRYHGGKKSMKKRILSIFDIRRKKLGVALVSLMLCASLGAGMAFALQTAGEPAGSAPPAVVSEPATDEERAYALNLLWLQKLDEVFDGYSSLNQTSIRSYMLAYDEVDEAEYERIRQVLLAMEDQHDVADMMRSGDFAIVQPSEEVQAFAREVVDAAGYEDWMIEGISLTLYPYGYAYDFEAATEFDTYWRIDLVEDSSEDASLATFWLKGDDKLYRMEQMADYRHEELRSLTQDERSQVLDRVLTYLRKYLYYLPEQEEHILQSDKVYQKNHIPEPVTAVWYFDGQEPYDVANEDEIIGYVIIIGVDTGRIYNIGWENDQASFANRWRAEKDWTETTGKAFPYPNQYYLWEIVSVEMTQLLDDLYARYADTLSDQEQLLFYVLRSEDAAALEAPNSHWPELMTVLRACETEQDFKDFLATRFIGINQSPPDEPQAEAILKRAEPSFEAIGAGEMRNRAFMYSTSFCSQAPGTYSVSAMDTFQRDNKYKLSFITTIGVDKEGMIVGLYYQGIYGDGALLVEATDEQKEAAKEIALAMIESGRIALATYDLDTLRVAQQVETSTDNITRAKVTVHTLFYLEDENGNRTDETEQGLLSMTVGLENGRLYGLERYFETNIDLEDTETHIHMARNG